MFELISELFVNYFFYILIIALLISIIMSTYYGYKAQKNLLKSFITTIIQIISWIVIFSPFFIAFISIPYTSHISMVIKLPIVLISFFIFMPYLLIILSPFATIHDNYRETGKIIIKYEDDKLEVIKKKVFIFI